jgi:glutathione S-transferase
VIIPRASDQKDQTTTEVEDAVTPPAAPVESTTVNSDFKGGPFTVRSDMIGAVLGGALNVPFRLGSGALVKGYKIENRPAAEVGNDRYAIPLAGRKFVEVANPGPRPEKPIEIYEFEGCPFCRKVREIVSILDIDVLFYPCPKNGPNFRPKANQMGGKKQFPYMVDPNKNVAMYESDDIIKHLVDNYGDGKVPVMLNLGALTTITAGLALIGRPGKGSTYVPAKLPEKPLELWAYESSPFCKIAREALCELELPHIYHSCARGSAKRDLLVQKTGKFQVPYLEDPNTGAAMFESHDIVEYVRKTYALAQA